MIKKLIAGLCLICGTAAFAQQNNASPYSFYGIGDTKFKGTAENKSMGGIGVLTDSIHLNLQNPASYGQLKFTTFTISGSTSSTELATSTESATAGRTTVDYIAIAFPFKKIGVAFGLMPQTSVGYRIQNTGEMQPDGFARIRRFEGSGGLNRAFGGVAYNITKDFAVGADFNYYFGSIDTKSIVGLENYTLQNLTRETNSSRYHAVSFNFGAYYQKLINKKYTWTASAVFTPEAALNGETNREIAVIQNSSNNSENVVDSYDFVVDGGDNNLPMKITAGTGFGQLRKWFAGVEFTHTGSNVLGNRFDNITNVSFSNGQRIAVGGFYIPKFYSYTSYLARITYRAGLRYEKTGLVINGQDINDAAVTLGLGLPLAGIGGSNLNIGLEYGQRGTKTAGLIQENYFNLSVSLSLNDKWFVKRRFE